MWRLLNQFLNDLNAVCCILQLDFIFEYLTVDDIFFFLWLLKILLQFYSPSPSLKNKLLVLIIEILITLHI